MRCPKCDFENPKGVELCQGCRRVKFVRRPKPPAEGARKSSGRVAKASGRQKKTSGRQAKKSSRVQAAAPSAETRRTPAAAPPSGAVKRAPPALQPKPEADPTATRRVPRGTGGPATMRVGKLPPGFEKLASRPIPPTIDRGALAAAQAQGGKHLLVRVGAPPIEIDTTRPFTIGRNDDCSLPVPSSRVSRVHAEIRADAHGRLLLEDKGSANGTFVGGKPVGVHALAPGDEIEIGPFLCVYRRGDAAPSGEPLGGRTMVDAGDMLSGQIGEGGLTEVLQGFDFNQKTGTLMVFSNEGQGWITFEKGSPQAAEAGELRDQEAVLFLLEIKAGRFNATPELCSKERRMKTNVTSLLLELGRRADERARGS